MVNEVFIDNYEIYEAQQDEWIDDEEEEIPKEERVYTTDEISEIKQEVEALNDFKKLAKSG